jgi:hypothetical protein
MKKITTLVLIGALAIAPVAMAQSANDENIKSDVGAINKDNAAIANDQNNIAADRAAKANDKANGNYGSQAVDSVKIGANQTAVAEKQTEKDVDKKILKHHKAAATTDTGDARTSTSTSNQ